jgi:Zn-finger nucleic acid-binding protein
MQSIDYEGVEIETCDRCGGEWLDPNELKSIVSAREKRWNAQELEDLKSAAIQGVKLDEVDEDLLCPNCSEPMDPINYAGDSGVILDKCTVCDGIWLDADEIEKVQMLVESWEKALPDDMKHYGARMRGVAAEVDSRDDVRIGRWFGIPSAIINRVLDLF